MHSRRLAGLLWFSAIALVLIACQGSHSEEPEQSLPDIPDIDRNRDNNLAAVESWGYQLQHIDLNALSASDYDLLVIDYADDNSQPFSSNDIDQLKANGKIVLSYFSIGEAETYRFYWNDGWLVNPSNECGSPLSSAAPDWLDPVNPDWCGNYPVKYWHDEWQALILTYLDAIVSAGFDGVYLDKVDSFYYWSGEEDLGASEVYGNAAAEMVSLVNLIAEYARSENPEFIIVPQNAAEIVEYLDEDQVSQYLSLINAVAIEDTFFVPSGGREAGNNPPYNPQDYILELLPVYLASGLPVLAVDYVSNAAKVERFYEEAQAYNLIPLTTVRDLDQLPVR